MYAYAANNPVKYTDPDGREAGDYFDTADDAAKDFAMTYNDDSIKKNVELASYIRIKNGKYYYDVPHEGNAERVDSYRNSNETDIVALIHTHGAYSEIVKLGENGIYYKRALEPSAGDYEDIKKTKLPLYTVTPDGGLFLSEFNPEVPSNIITYSFTPRAPSDPNCPFRKNNINAYLLPNNITISSEDYLKGIRK